MTTTSPPPKENAHGAASIIGQLLGEVIVHHAPWTSEISETTRRRIADDWLENLEQHTTGLIGPLVDQMLAVTDPPPEVRKLLTAAQDPSAQFGSLLQQFFVYGLMFQLAGTMLAPFTQQVQNDVWSAHPDRPLSPPDLATAVVRGIGHGDSSGVTIPDWATKQAAESGMSAEDFATFVGTTGMAPALQLLFEMVRRDINPEGELNAGGITLVSGIQQGDIKDEWIEAVSKLRYVQPSPTDFVRAAIQAQMPYDEAATWATKVGLEPPAYLNDNPDWFKLLFDTAGRPPGPVEMAHAALRGLTSWTGTGPDSVSFAQAIAESDIKTKYTPLLQALATYYPPPGEVRTLLLHGGIDKEQAIAYWQADGIPAELAKAYAYLAETEQITQDKALAKGDILTLVQEQAISDSDARTMLEQIGYTGENATHLIEMAHFRYELEALRNSVRTVARLYTTRKVNATQAKAALESIGLPAIQVGSLMDTLTVQRDNIVLEPTAAQIAGALFYGVIDQAEATAMLIELGYSDYGAYIVLSDRMHTALPNRPPTPSSVV